MDDYPVNVELLAANLERLGHEVVPAVSGEEALASVAADPPDVVLMDNLMPGLSGLDVLRAIRGRAETADLPVIMVSGLGDTDHVVEGLALGANDYVAKPIDMAILQARLATQIALKRARDDLKRTAILLGEELDRKARDLAMASHVQRSILPSLAPSVPGVRVAWHYRPATEVGGDLFDAIELPGGRLLLFVADAMGHGVQAALVVSTLKATLAAHLAEADELSGLMTRLDRALGSLFEDRYVTAAACVLDPSTRLLRYVVAGHPPILVSGPDGVSALSTGGLPLGTSLEWSYRSATAELPEGASLLLFSDGLTEAEGPGGHQLGLDAVADRLLESDPGDPDVILADLLAALEGHSGQEDLADDLTILVASLVP